MVSIWSKSGTACSVITLLTFTLPSSPQAHKTERGGTQSVNADSAKAGIVSLLFIAPPDHHPEDRRAFYHLKRPIQTPAEQ